LVEAVERHESDQAWAATLNAAADVFTVAAKDPQLGRLKQLTPAAKVHCKLSEIAAMSPQLGAATDIMLDIPLDRLRDDDKRQGRDARRWRAR